MSTSLILLEEKYRRAMAFGKYLDQHPEQGPLAKELQRSLTNYRIALSNFIKDQRPDKTLASISGE